MKRTLIWLAVQAVIAESRRSARVPPTLLGFGDHTLRR